MRNVQLLLRQWMHCQNVVVVALDMYFTDVVMVVIELVALGVWNSMCRLQETLRFCMRIVFNVTVILHDHGVDCLGCMLQT